MHRQGCINLPPAQERRWLNYPKRCDDKHLSACNAQAGEQESEAIECDLSELGEIRIIKVSSKYSKSHGIWKEMMNRNHYLGSGPLCGNQMKYLIESDRYGYVGGIAFSSSEWSLEALWIPIQQ